jgi:hypothetical protein
MATATKKLPKSREIVSRSWTVYKAHFKIILMYLGPLFVGFIVAEILATIDTTAALSISGVTYAATVIYSIWMSIVLTRLIYQGVSGKKKLNEAKAKENVWGRVLPWIGVSIITGVLVLLGTIAFIVPGIILAMMYFTAQYGVIIENKGVHDSISDSIKVTKNRKMNMFWTFLLASLIVILIYLLIAGVVGAALSAALAGLGTYELGATIGTLTAETLTLPMFLAISLNIYHELIK